MYGVGNVKTKRKDTGVVGKDCERAQAGGISLLVLGLLCGLCGPFSIGIAASSILFVWYWRVRANLQHDERGTASPVMWIAIAAIVIAAMVILFFYLMAQWGYEFGTRQFDNP